MPALLEMQVRLWTLLSCSAWISASQGVTLTFDQTLIDHFAEEGYKPEFGARELKRLIRSELETALAREMLGGGIGKADHASARWDD